MLLKETLVVLTSELDDSKINGRDGRDHWPTATAFMAGGGVKGGTTYGETGHVAHLLKENPSSRKI